MTLNRVWVVRNVAISGGTSIQDGYAGSPGSGGAYLWNFQNTYYSSNLTNVVFADNQLVKPSSGRPDRGGGGGGLVVQGSRVNITHYTFASNRFEGPLRSGQAILVQGSEGTKGIPGVANIQYSIIADHVLSDTNNTSALTVSEGSTANLYRNLFAGNTNNTNSDGRPLPPGTIIGLDTSIYASSVGFVSSGSPNYDYHILSISPAIGGAVGSTTQDDIDGQSRPYGMEADIGADEYVPPTLFVTPQEVTVITAEDTSITRSVFIDVKNSKTAVYWEAVSPVSWLLLGPNRSNTASGQSGEWLQLHFIPEGLPLGTYQTGVTITSTEADSVTLHVRMLKAERVFSIYLPVIFRHYW